jgi:hypothetical protein
MRRVQELLSNDSELKTADKDESFTPAAVALTSKRLTFAWLDGEAQKVSFFFFFFNYYIKHAVDQKLSPVECTCIVFVNE